jgi:hypothetical protein
MTMWHTPWTLTVHTGKTIGGHLADHQNIAAKGPWTPMGSQALSVHNIHSTCVVLLFFWWPQMEVLVGPHCAKKGACQVAKSNPGHGRVSPLWPSTALLSQQDSQENGSEWQSQVNSLVICSGQPVAAKSTGPLKTSSVWQQLEQTGPRSAMTCAPGHLSISFFSVWCLWWNPGPHTW